MTIDLILSGGQVVTSHGLEAIDVGISEGRIVSLGKNGTLGVARRTADVTGKIVVPGSLDVHVHLEEEFGGTKLISTFPGGTKAAALAGVTTIIDFASRKPGLSLNEAVAARKALAAGRSAVDYSFHVVVDKVDDDVLREVPELVLSGLPSFKVFTIYAQMISDGALLDLMRVVGRHSGIIAIHAENAAIAEYNVAHYIKHGMHTAKYHALSKPRVVEAEAIQRVLYLARYAGVGCYIMHISTREGVELVRDARREGQPIYGETCTHYLILTEDMYEREDGYLWIISPPLREGNDRASLWRGLDAGVLSTVSSDEGSWSRKDKEMKKDRFDCVPNGAPGIGVRIPVLISEGVNQGRLSWQTFAAVASTNAARIHGLYPRKGIVAIGSDADLAVINPNASWTLGLNSLHMEADWCVLPEFEVRGRVEMTFLRGKPIVEEGEYVGELTDGRFLERHISKEVLRGPAV